MPDPPLLGRRRIDTFVPQPPVPGPSLQGGRGSGDKEGQDGLRVHCEHGGAQGRALRQPEKRARCHLNAQCGNLENVRGVTLLNAALGLAACRGGCHRQIPHSGKKRPGAEPAAPRVRVKTQNGASMATPCFCRCFDLRAEDEYWNNLVLGTIGGTLEPDLITGLRLVDRAETLRSFCLREGKRY